MVKHGGALPVPRAAGGNRLSSIAQLADIPEEVDDMLKEAIIERQVRPHKFDKGAALNSKGRMLLKAFGA